jgi:hypothetical protein
MMYPDPGPASTASAWFGGVLYSIALAKRRFIIVQIPLTATQLPPNCFPIARIEDERAPVEGLTINW